MLTTASKNHEEELYEKVKLLDKQYTLIYQMAIEFGKSVQVNSKTRSCSNITDRVGFRHTNCLYDALHIWMFTCLLILWMNRIASAAAVDFDSMLVVKWDSPFEGKQPLIQANASCTRVPNGKGLFLVTGLKSGNPEERNILAQSRFENGLHAGRMVHEFASTHKFNSPALSYDGKTIAFAYSNGYNAFGDHPCDFNIYTVNIDGRNLRELTHDSNNYHPCLLPNGRIVFISERWNNAFVRCSAGGLDVGQETGLLSSMNADGSDLIRLSYHETDELFPSVDKNGMIVYTRWDYIDRDFNAAHHLWICGPDGSDPRAPHGNYPMPHYGGGADGRSNRPWAEQMIRAIPGSAKYIAVATLHHGPTYGDLILIDTRIEDDNAMSQITRITNIGKPFLHEPNGDAPEEQLSDLKSGKIYYTTPWPLSEDRYLAAKADGGIYLVDKSGTDNLLYKSSGFLRHPIPLQPRTRPPSIPSKTFQGSREQNPEHHRAVISVQSVYTADFDWPKGTKITALRIVQLLPRPKTATSSTKENLTIGCPGSMGRMSLGTVPVEEDGSAYFEAPVGKLILFQALDEDGAAVQSMRSGTYVHPGEHLSCIGCHENKWKTPSSGTFTAMRRAPSLLRPEPEGSLPLSFPRLVAPVLTQKCDRCHAKQNPKLRFIGGNMEELFEQAAKMGNTCYSGQKHSAGVNGEGYRTQSGNFGARTTSLGRAMLGAKHKQRAAQGHITEEDMYRIIIWLDCGSQMYSAFRDKDKQWAGEIVWPEIDVDPQNPTGVEKHLPFPGEAASAQPENREEPEYLNLPRSINFTVNAGKLIVSNAGAAAIVTVLTINGSRLFSAHCNNSGRTEVDLRSICMKSGIFAIRIETSDSRNAESSGLIYIR